MRPGTADPRHLSFKIRFEFFKSNEIYLFFCVLFLNLAICLIQFFFEFLTHYFSSSLFTHPECTFCCFFFSPEKPMPTTHYNHTIISLEIHEGIIRFLAPMSQLFSSGVLTINCQYLYFTQKSHLKFLKMKLKSMVIFYIPIRSPYQKKVLANSRKIIWGLNIFFQVAR